MQKKKVTRALQAVGQYPGKALFIAKPKKLITAMENLLDLADMCGLTVADEDTQPESLLQNQPQPQANMVVKPVLPSGISGRSGGKARGGLSSLFEESDDDVNVKSDPFLEAWFTQLLPPIPSHSQQQLRLTAEDEDTGDKEKITSGPLQQQQQEKITSGPLQQQQQEKTTPGPLQQQQFDPLEAKMTFRSHPTVI
uniref:Uncharacterized protein n=1 Tax=Chromera velia CCMP2878 TaxID=1169474 RepID=A0A0G4HR16_9ALVE|eukprot:Cvel_30414.t1-p1 / transcript=Cvel_30414.t1 / gene=Cvel_30414 / organism=Chromera_velia_CCMP2878 / gene_product=hypothetical protein / transcript_product=hypothetical protein / location=Cvel_scaffold4333:1896-3175(-) / protein_length=195 / sequence_SO=supercontig / SO=protein_coding / is_pseudo=false